MLLLKLPVPEPLEVLLLAVVGLDEVLQHTPRAVTLAPPSLVTLPPLLAVVAVAAFAANEVFSHGWGNGRGHMGPGYGRGYGHMGPGYGRGYGQRGPGYMNNNNFGKMNYLKEWLGLNEKQVEKIFKIGSKYRELYFKNRGNRDKVYSLRNEHNKEIENVLTKSQKEKFNSRRNRGNSPGYRDCGW